ncbi:ead/Ea22-like family protein [Klebsiella pneumoniae subsp. pneumoniae]|uniref:ead/Ea22-like family protein n=2 Tax=Klebsiella TaxID=570 RepID=UPI000CEC05CC|nr:ead/Ea22-like family protein [Klebsiella pneumoniae]HDK6067381.1 ead/Ea22-like family protein [Klebsiella variicola]EKU3005060.1 ead/Ea22-like family protein [Klebsiella pneumoniae]ROF18296.1 ead/Ea22-like family protein [Klebsiella pneumoniae subsp. pneumoniae]ROG04196.1 ead/Ea22-like family protein [Klebsiella pneumoniae subsp. pneumoniae]TYE25908.1 ead/Ea22-like family protein [Klebsiella pneumoniae]
MQAHSFGCLERPAMTDITELAQSLKAAAENAIGAHERLAAYPYGEIIDISQHEGEQIDIDITDINEFHEEASPANVLALVEALEKAQKRIAELENNEVQEEGNQFLVVRHPGKVPVIKHPVGELEDYLRQIFKADPLATIDIVTHRYYGVGGQFVEDADEYLHEMSIKVEAE